MGLDQSYYKEIQLRNGQLLTLRNPVVDDAEQMIAYLNTVGGETDNLSFGGGEFPLTVEEEREYLRKAQENPNIFMVLGIIDGEVVSLADISSPSRKRLAHNSQIGISVRKDYWGLGIGTAVMHELIQFAKGTGRIRNISLGVKASNTRAIRLYERFGFVKVGVHKDFFNTNGVYDDEILMDLQIDL